MDPDVPSGMGSFFQGMLGDMLKLLHTDAPLQWDLALSLAHSIAAEDGGDENVDPLQRIGLEELLRIAELHVADVTGLSLNEAGRPPSLVAVSRAAWAQQSLASWKGLLEEIAGALAPAPDTTSEASVTEEYASDEGDFSALLGQWASVLAPAMTAMQIGSIVGHLARRCLGQYELPLPREAAELLVVPTNTRRFANDWSLPEADVALWCLVRDLATHAVLLRPHVRARLSELLVAHARGVRPDPRLLEQRLGELGAGASDPRELARLFSEPGMLGALGDTPELRRVNNELGVLVATVLGYAAYVTDTVALRAIGAGVPIREAMRRARVERGEDERGAEALLGLALDQDVVDTGEAFIRGVLDRGGESELARLWTEAANLPTPSEFEAPGLWIERINLPRDDGTTSAST